MTATTVNGIDVIADQPAQSPIKTKDGKAVFFKQIRELLLADGTTRFGCVHCDYTALSHTQVRPHLSKHKTRVATAAADLSLAQLLARLAELDAVTADRDQWKTRALKAEGSLKMLRDALGGSR